MKSILIVCLCMWGLLVYGEKNNTVHLYGSLKEFKAAEVNMAPDGAAGEISDAGVIKIPVVQFLIIRPIQFFHCCLCPLIHLIKLLQKGKFKLPLGNNFSCKLPDLFQFTIMPSVFFICFGSFRYPMFQFITHNDM